jgi:hypothetical protein
VSATRGNKVLRFRPAGAEDTSAPTAGAAFDYTGGAGQPTMVVAQPPTLMTLQHLGPEITLLYPLYVTVEGSGALWFASSTDLALVAEGETDDDALEELRELVRWLFVELSELRDSLGPVPLAQLIFLERLAGIQRGSECPSR